MKKSYRKPLVYCENHGTGAAVSNSEEYEQEMKRKLAEMKIEIDQPEGYAANVEKIMTGRPDA